MNVSCLAITQINIYTSIQTCDCCQGLVNLSNILNLQCFLITVLKKLMEMNHFFIVLLLVSIFFNSIENEAGLKASES